MTKCDSETVLTCPKCHSTEIADYMAQNKGYEGYKICLKCYHLFRVKPKHRPMPYHSRINEDVREDSEADGAILFDDWMFPPDF